MILVDTSVWIDHFRAPEVTLAELLSQSHVLAHPFVIGELAMSSMKDREVVLASFEELRRPVIAKDEEVLRFVAQHRLFGGGMGYIDAHLLVSAQLTPEAQLWTRDKRLLAVAQRLGLAAQPKAMHVP